MDAEEARLVAERIASGHAYQKHVVGGKEFDSTMTAGHFAELIEAAITNATKMKILKRGRTAYYYQPLQMIVIHDPAHLDLGSAFIPGDGYRRFRELR